MRIEGTNHGRRGREGLEARGRLRVALISPKGPLYRRSGIFKQSLRYMPLTFPTLAALIPEDLDVELSCHDEGLADVDPARIDADLVGMTVITGNAVRAYELAAAFRARGAAVVLGGPHITLVPEDAMPHADAIVVGYAEETWPALLRDFAAGQMKPRYDQAPDLKLTGYPLPDRSVLPSRQYILTNVFEATRSCIHACEFCVAPAAWGRKPLQKPVEAVVDDIRQRRARRALFVDLNLISDREYACKLFRALAPLRIRWFGLATMRVAADEELLDLLQASGCRGLLIGFESIVPQNLRSTKKTFNHPEQYGHVVEKLHEHGMAVQGCFVFGMDEDTPEVCEQTARLAVEIGVDLPRFAISTPFPGTPLYRRLEAEGRILTRNWELYDGQHAVFQPAKMSTRELEQATGAAWRHAYSWKSIAQRLKKSPGPMHAVALTNLGYRYYAYNVDRFYNCDWALAADPLRSVGALPAAAREAIRQAAR